MPTSLANAAGRARKISRGVSLARFSSQLLAPAIPSVQTRDMGKLVGILVFVAVGFGIFYFVTKRMPTTDSGTAPTQAISLTGVRSDLLKIAQAERSNLALNSHCVEINELISNGSLSMSRPEREGYSYEIRCNGDSGEFAVTAHHAPAPVGSPIRYPILAIDQNMQIGEVQ